MKFFTFLLSLTFLNFVNAQNLPGYVPSNGLVGWWPFSGDANDQSNNGFDGVVSGAVLTTDRNGDLNSAYNFDGVNDFISMSGITNVYTSYSISCWISTNEIPSQAGEYKGIVSKGSWGENHGGDHTFFLVLQDRHYFPSDKGVLIGYESSTGSNSVLNHNAITDYVGNWKHLVVSYNNVDESLSIYVDGELVEGTSTSVNINNNTEPLIVGNMYTPPSSQPGMLNAFFNGKIDDIGVWDRVLTSEEITELYNSPLSINELNNQLSFSVYPNPTKNDITIFVSEYTSPIDFSIYDNSGKIIFTSKINSELTTIDISKFSQGTYNIVLNQEKGNLVPLIKQ